MLSSSNDKPECLLSCNEAISLLSAKTEHEISNSVFNDLKKHFLIIGFRHNDEEWYLQYDIELIARWLKQPLSEGTFYKRVKQTLFDAKEYISLSLDGHTSIIFNSNTNTHDPTYFSALKNFLAFAATPKSSFTNDYESLTFFSNAEILTRSPEIKDFIVKQMVRQNVSSVESVSQFARSASYMGSKKTLTSFLVEAISCVLPDNGIVVDLMCGSGAAASSFAKIWSTIVSDAQDFCRLLATVQGGGYSMQRAQALIPNILKAYKANFAQLSDKLACSLRDEDRIFHGGFDDLVGEYRRFVDQFPLFPNHAIRYSWDPFSEISAKKKAPSSSPYLLFTSYFANVYFGLKQCIEIDSLRYAIDQIEDPLDREWALGCLIVTVSLLGTTYAGHFAQPAYPRPDNITSKNIYKILDKRNKSVTQEFCIRFLSLSSESEHCKFPILSVEGPWQPALENLSNMIVPTTPTLVYLDAPYTREEYSRYYHVLETLVKYHYPSSTGLGRIPNKALKERFDSEFFTKRTSSVNSTFVNIIRAILERGWSCAWSYSDSGLASMYEVINTVNSQIRCNVKAYCVPYSYKPQGKHGIPPKKVGEHLILFYKGH